jgi:hypothetical protein
MAGSGSMEFRSETDGLPTQAVETLIQVGIKLKASPDGQRVLLQQCE